MLDRLTSMRVFTAVVRHGTFSGAADELGLSRAMASKHVSALESRLGVRLLNRSTRVTRLTEAGQRYFERLDDLLGELDHLETRLHDEQDRVAGNLTIAAPPAFGAFHLAPVIAAFMRDHPDVRVQLLLDDRIIDLVDEDVDIAVTLRDLEDSSYIARRLTSVRMKICASPGYLARHATPAAPEDLAAHNCLIYGESAAGRQSNWPFQRDGDTLSVRVRGNFVSNVGDALRHLALADGGIVRLPSYIVRADLARGDLVTILEDFSEPLRPVHALYAHRDYVPAKVRGFLDFAIATFDEDRRQRSAAAPPAK